MTETKVVDGADRRKVRLLDLIHFIHTNKGGKGATNKECLAFMTLKYGLRNETTTKYLQELHMASVIFRGGASNIDTWFTTGAFKQSKFAKYLYGE